MYDYVELCQLLPELEKYIVNGKLNYNDTGAVRVLNRALLLKQFKLKVDLPVGHLCPTVPNRAAYIDLIEFVINQIFKLSPGETTGIDIGTGASCIYPLIGCARNPNWTFIATDIDDEVLSYAKANLHANASIVSNRIKLLKNCDPNSIFTEDLITSLPEVSFKFLICNPPFYTDLDELEERRSCKRFKPTTGEWCMTQSEFSTELGGESGFISQMIKESIAIDSIKAGINLFSCMLGLKESLGFLLDLLEKTKLLDDSHSLSYAFQNLKIKHTTRYILLWSFTHHISSEASTHRLKITRKTHRTQEISIYSNEFDFEKFCLDLKTYYGCNSAGNDLKVTTDTYNLTLTHNKWSRKSRRSPSSAPLLDSPIHIDIYLVEDKLVFSVDPECDWEIFLGFINHLRKEIK